jgi:hypothetical protein
VSMIKLTTQSRVEMTNNDQISELPLRVENKYMGRRIYSQNLKEATKLHKLNSEIIIKKDIGIPEYQSRVSCTCK